MPHVGDLFPVNIIITFALYPNASAPIYSSDDLPLVIGNHGKNINAIRTIVQASSFINDGKRVLINVDSY